MKQNTNMSHWLWSFWWDLELPYKECTGRIMALFSLLLGAATSSLLPLHAALSLHMLSQVP